MSFFTFSGPQCKEWCASQVVTVAYPHMFLVVLAGCALAAFFIFRAIYTRNPSMMDEDRAEMIVNILLYSAQIMLICTLIYHYYRFNPQIAGELADQRVIQPLVNLT